MGETMISRGGDGQWFQISERGSVAGIWFLVVLSTIFGRMPARAFLRILVPYYVLIHGTAREASRGYLQRLRGEASLLAVHDHILRFAQCTLDRLFFVRGIIEPFEVHSHGEEHLRELFRERRGAILLGAHLGSFEAMQRMADSREMPIHVVGYFRNAKMFNAALNRLNPRSKARLIEFDPESIDFVLKIREIIEGGGLVAILGDRTRPGGRSATVSFLGELAHFPTGAYLLASVLKCPVYLTFGLHTPPNRYDLYCELFSERIKLPRRGRKAALREQAQRFAERLEHYCRLAPDNWFNFYEFWTLGPDEQLEPQQGRVARQQKTIEGTT